MLEQSTKRMIEIIKNDEKQLYEYNYEEYLIDYDEYYKNTRDYEINYDCITEKDLPLSVGEVRGITDPLGNADEQTLQFNVHCVVSFGEDYGTEAEDVRIDVSNWELSEWIGIDNDLIDDFNSETDYVYDDECRKVKALLFMGDIWEVLLTEDCYYTYEELTKELNSFLKKQFDEGAESVKLTDW